MWCPAVVWADDRSYMQDCGVDIGIEALVPFFVRLHEGEKRKRPKSLEKAFAHRPSDANDDEREAKAAIDVHAADGLYRSVPQRAAGGTRRPMLSRQTETIMQCPNPCVPASKLARCVSWSARRCFVWCMTPPTTGC